MKSGNDYQQAMTPNGYQNLAERTSGASSNEDRIMYTALGLAGEAGEIANLTKKVIFHKHPYNPEKFLDELGDCQWYLAMAAKAHGYTLQEVMDFNIKKLKERYPDGFTAEASINRKK